MNLFNKIFKSKKSENEGEFTTITRTEVFEGLCIPGIINNTQYFFTGIEIYSDGLISCWEMVDLTMFKEKLHRNWVVTAIPDGQAISISSLGKWYIENGEWQHTKESFYEYVYSLVKKLNPTLENLHNYNGSNSKIIGKANVAKHFIPNSKPYHLDAPDSFLPNKISGEKFNVFYRDNDKKIYLAKLSIYKSGHVEITDIPAKIIFTFDSLKDLMDTGHIATNLKIGDRVFILGLGSFAVKSGEGIDMSHKYSEFKDTFEELNGRENSIQKCARIFEEYKKNLTKRAKEELREAYEAIPEHLRIYVGTMDTKDYEVRQIIYGDIVKKEWEENYGFEYPYDDMPKPLDE